MKNRSIKLISIIIIITMLASVLSSCESQPIKSSKSALASVGTVGDYEITYEELYFLAYNYSAELTAEHGKNGWGKEQLIERINENIVSNYAVLTPAKEAGISMDTDDHKEKVQIALDSYIESEFGGKRGNYKKTIKDMGATDNYVRFTIGVELLYSELVSEYLKTGVLSDEEAFIRKTIKDEFIRTWHIMISNEDGSQENYSKAEEALKKIKSGTSMYEMIGSIYNEDFMETSLDGYYFIRGTMDEAYEEAAYDLRIDGISDIVRSVGQNGDGETVDCYYIIQRLPLEDHYINKNFETLKDQYYTSVVYGMVEELSDSLKFVPNEYFNTLDILNLKAPKQTDPVIVITLTSVGIAVMGAATAIVLVVRNSRKKIAAQENIYKNKSLNSGKNK